MSSGPPTATELLRERVRAFEPWFYDFELAAGVRTGSKLDAQVAPVHETRRAMLGTIVEQHFGSRLPGLRALDLGCHEGWFSVALARWGFERVVGVDVRPGSLEKARFVASTLGLRGLEFVQADCEELDRHVSGPFELCLCVGLLYHLENPMRVLRRAAALTSEMIVVETQVIDEVEGRTEWGRREHTLPYAGALALVDESHAHGTGCPEAGGTSLALCPSPRALHTMLRAVGFTRSLAVEPPPGAYEQHARGKRVVVIGRR